MALNKQDLNMLSDETIAKFGRKNLVINGCFSAFQRGNPITQPFNEYLADRWRHSYSTSPAPITMTRINSTAGEPFRSDQFANITTGSPTGAASNQRIVQTIETTGHEVSNVEVSYSFWARGVGLEEIKCLGIFIPIVLTGSWQKFSGTLMTPTNIANPSVIEFRFSNSTILNIQLAEVQVEYNSVSSFERLTQQENLANCQRYFHTSFNQGTTPANGVDATSFAEVRTVVGQYDQGNFVETSKTTFPSTMRIKPGITLYGNSSGEVLFLEATTNNSVTQQWRSETQVNIQGGDNSIGVYAPVTQQGWVYFHYTADAEL